MSFKAHWTTGKNTDGYTVHTYHVAPFQIGGTVTEQEHFDNEKMLSPLRVYLGGDWKMTRSMMQLTNAKRWIEQAWLRVLQRRAPEYLP